MDTRELVDFINGHFTETNNNIRDMRTEISDMKERCFSTHQGISRDLGKIDGKNALMSFIISTILGAIAIIVSYFKRGHQ